MAPYKTSTHPPLYLFRSSKISNTGIVQRNYLLEGADFIQNFKKKRLDFCTGYTDSRLLQLADIMLK